MKMLQDAQSNAVIEEEDSSSDDAISDTYSDKSGATIIESNKFNFQSIIKESQQKRKELEQKNKGQKQQLPKTNFRAMINNSRPSFKDRVSSAAM